VDIKDKQRWALNHRVSGCPSGQRNADEHECLHAVEEAVIGDYIVAEFKVLTPSESGALSFLPGCSYSNETRRAVFNRNRAGSSFGNVRQNYRHVCTNDEADMKLVAGHSKPHKKKEKSVKICPKPATWCVHVGATNEPQHCDDVPGHFCYDIYGKSGFKPCDDKITPTWGHFECMGADAPGEPKKWEPPAKWKEREAAAAANDAARETEADKRSTEIADRDAGIASPGAAAADVAPGSDGGSCASAGCNDVPSARGPEAKEPNRKKEGHERKYVEPEWSLDALTDVFKNGKPSNFLQHAGLLIHGFDGTETSDERWQPCNVGWCQKAKSWWSTSLINRQHPTAFAANGIVLSPSAKRTKVLCSHYCDFGSLLDGCNASASDGFEGRGVPYPPEHLKYMLERSIFEESQKGAYNEVLVDMRWYADNLPQSVAGFFFTCKSEAWAEVQATQAYVSFLDHYNLTEESIPLIKLRSNMTAGGVMEDVSGSARRFLEKDRYSKARAKWYANHQHLEHHPEELPDYLREQAAQRGEHVRLDMETGGEDYSGGWVRGHSHPW